MAEWNHTTDLRERVARALAEQNGSLEVFENYPEGTAYRDTFLNGADAAIKAVGAWFRDNGYLHADGVLGIGEEASR